MIAGVDELAVTGHFCDVLRTAIVDFGDISLNEEAEYFVRNSEDIPAEHKLGVMRLFHWAGWVPRSVALEYAKTAIQPKR